MKRMMLIGLALVMCGCAGDDKEATHKTLTMDQTPLAVRRGIEKAYPGAKVLEIEKETYKDTGVVHYEVEVITAKGQKVEFELAEDGEKLEKH